MTIKRIVMAVVLVALISASLPIVNAQAPPCFTFDGQIKTMQCPVSFRPEPVQYYSNAQSGFSPATDNGDRLPGGFFDQRTIDTLRQNSAQNQSQNATAAADQNQTAPAATKLTSSDIEPVRNSLNTTRESLEHNDTQAAIESINRADGALFAIIQKEPRGPVRDQLTTLINDTDRTRQSVYNLNNEKARVDLDAADSQLLVITEMLPTSTPTVIATEEPQPEPQANQTNAAPPLSELDQFRENLRQRQEQQEREQNQTNSITILPGPTEAASTSPQVQPPQQEPTIKIPLNKTQQEIITIEEGGGLNKTTHEKTTISIIEGNKTTHRDVTTTEVPL